MDLPLYFYKACYLVGLVLMLGPEVIAAFFDEDRGDTISEISQPIIQSNSLLRFLVVALCLWLAYHLAFETDWKK